MVGSDIALQVILDFSKVQQQVGQLRTLINKGTGTGTGGKGTGTVVPNVIGKDSIQKVSKFTQMLNGLGLAGNSVGGIFTKLAGKVLAWLSITTVIFTVIRLIGSLVTEMKTLQDAQVRLQRILKSTGDELEADTRKAMGFAQAMNALAGASYKDTIDALTTAAKAGFEFADAMSVAQSALLAINITEISDIGEATKYLIATIRQFNLEAIDSLWILNQWNELAKRTGATAEHIAEGVVRAGKAWKSVGGTLGQLNAIVATTIEQTGESGGKIGTMLKTLSARYADVNRAKSLNNQLELVGIKLLKDDGRMFNTIFQVMGELASKWGTLDDVMKANIAKASVGVRQYSRFLGVVENFDAVIRAVAISIDSNNSALTENERRTKSLDFAIRRLKGAWSELAQNTTVIQAITNAIQALKLVVSGLATPTGKLILTFTAWSVATLILSKGIRRLILSLRVLHIVNNMVAMSTLKWTSVIAVLVTTIGGYLAITKVTRNASMEFVKVQVDTTKALIKSREELSANTAMFVKYYKNLDLNTKKGQAHAKIIEDMFKNVANGLDLSSTVGQFNSLNDAMLRIKKTLEELASPKNVLKEYASGIEAEVNKSTQGYKKLYERLTNTQNPALGSANIARRYSVLKDPLQTITDDLNDAIELQKRLQDEGINTNKIMSKGGKGKTKFDIAMSKEDVVNTQNYINAVAGGKITLQQFIDELTKEQKLLTDIGKEKVLSDMVVDDKVAEKQFNDLLKISQRYYEEQDKLAKESFDKRQKLTESLVTAFTGTFTYDVELADNKVVAGLQNVAGAVFKNTMDEFNKGVVAMFTGPAPESAADKMKNALFLGGEEAENRIVAGLMHGTETLEQALNIWTLNTAKLLKIPQSELAIIQGNYNTARTGTGFDVKGIQESANLQGAKLKVDGDLGESTRKAIEKYLTPENDLSSDKSLEYLKAIAKASTQAGIANTAVGAGMSMNANTGVGVSTGFDPLSMLLSMGASYLFGSLFAPKPEPEVVEDQIKFAEESLRELKTVNRNLTTLVDNTVNYGLINESYYFALNSQRGLVNV